MPCDYETDAYRLVALDIDGTVLNSAQEVSTELRGVLARLAERGVRTVLSTGRRWRTTVPVLRELGHVHPVAVCSGGALIKNADDERTLFTAPMPHATAKLTLRLFRQAGLVPFMLYDRPLSGREMKVSVSERDAASGLPYVQANEGAFEHYEGSCPSTNERTLTIFCVDHGERVRPAERPVVEGLGDVGIVKVMAQERYGPGQLAIEVHDPSATKWSALRHLLSEWAITPQQVVAIGDDVNDIPMLEAAGLSFAMGNAVPEVMEAADALTASNDEHGAAQALRRVFAL